MSSNWRKLCGNSRRGCLNAVLHNNFPDIPHDVNFIVGKEKKIISCHKIFLAIASPVFEAMFSDRHKTTVEAQTDTNMTEVPLLNVHVHPIALENLIQFAYIGEATVNIEDAVVTMLTADMYDMPELVSYCAEFIEENLNIETVNLVELYKITILLNNERLQEKVRKYIAGNFYKLIELDEFFEFSSDNLCSFLKLDHLTVRSEFDLFQAVLRWASRQCELKGLNQTPENHRAELTDILPHIRFHLMSFNEVFNRLVEPVGVLTKDECHDKTSETLTKKYMGNRNFCGRQNFTAVFAVPNIRDTHIGIDSVFHDSFMVSGDVPSNLKLKSVGFVALQDAKVTITNINGMIEKNTHQLRRVDNLSSMQYVDLPELLHIQPNVRYDIIVSIAKGQLAFFPEQRQGWGHSRSCSDLFTLTLHSKVSPIWALDFLY